MKLSDIKPIINEYYIGVLSPMSIEQVMTFFDDAVQERHHIVIKDDGPTAFVYRFDFDSRQSIYILVNFRTKEYYGHCTIEKIQPNIFQPIDINIVASLRGYQLAPQLYSFISKSQDVSIINGKQLSLSAERMWLKFPNKQLYNMDENKVYDINDTNKDYPKNDNNREDQTWFYIWKETSNILETYRYLGEKFDYDEFLKGNPGLILGKHHKLDLVPMTPIFHQQII